MYITGGYDDEEHPEHAAHSDDPTPLVPPEPTPTEPPSESETS